MMARPGRTAAVVGAVVAFAAVTLMGMLAGSAAAATPGSCLENVNVRAEPTTDARIVALCEAGTDVTTGAVRNGFVRIENLGGWAAEQYIGIEGAPSGTARTTPSTSDDPTTGPSTTAPRSGDGTGDDADDPARTGDDDVQESGSTTDGTDAADADTTDADTTDDEDGAPLGGLLGG